MPEPTPDAKARLLQATIEILNEEDDPARITVRQIAERAGVALGSINYYFQSKDNLLYEAVSHLMTSEATRWFAPDAQDATLDPVTRLKQLLKETSRIGIRYPKLMRIMVEYDLQHGEMTVPLMLMPLLHEISGGRRSEFELRLIALQLITTLQVMFLRAPTFRLYAGIDVLDDTQRDRGIDLLVDLALANLGGQ